MLFTQIGNTILRLFLILLVTVSLSGCGSGVNTSSVSGKVTMADGSPAKSGTVTFEQVGGGKSISCIGDIKPDGSYSLFMDENTSGAPPGQYKVMVNVTNEAGEGITNPKYSNVDDSPLSFTVKPGKNTFDIKLE